MEEVLEPATPVVEAIFGAVALPVLIYFLLINTSYLVLVVAAALEFRRSTRQLPFAGREELLGSGLVPGVSVVTSMYNEEVGIKVATQSMLALHYPRHEVIVVDDGSSDGGFEVLRAAFDLVEVPRRMPTDVAVREVATSVHVPRNGRTRLTVVRKPNSGRSDSLNVGVNFATQDLVVFVDSDSVLDPDALLAVARPFAEDPVRMVAGGGVIRAVNGCSVRGGRVTEVRMSTSWLARIQVVEYLRAFHLGRCGWSRLKSLILISGAFGVFRRDVLVEVGGLDPGSIGEDFELVMRVHRHMRRTGRDYRVQFITEPICWTEVPETTAVLRKQRRRWHRGLWETLWAYRSMLLNPRYGRVGLIAVPYYWLFELIAPALELFGLVLVVVGWLLGVVDMGYFLLFMAVAYGYAMLVTLAAMTVEELSFHKYPRWRDLVSTAASAVVENLGYRQATAIWRLEGWAQSLAGRKQEWGTMTRTGFDTADRSDG
ncbi:glycosyltransferase family 2 protein [Janibacter sp. DB-40]|uniref:glycosyltransferase family 2 protein n=1 Tax=Janibacter sp. DB-40 TaxID=3028808 RepID=UPI002404E8B4|nr:glycosyltransferase family 2 protein [Janibacter sp. DB-40]